MRPHSFAMKLTSRWHGATRHLIGLVVSWLGFSVLLGLFHEFDRMEASNAAIPSLAIGALVAETSLTFLFGVIILATPIFIWWLQSRDNDKRIEITSNQ